MIFVPAIGMSQSHDNSPDTSVDSEDDFRPCDCQRTFLRSLQLTVGLYEHPAKDGTTEAAKTMVNTLNIEYIDLLGPPINCHLLLFTFWGIPEELLVLKV